MEISEDSIGLDPNPMQEHLTFTNIGEMNNNNTSLGSMSSMSSPETYGKDPLSPSTSQTSRAPASQCPHCLREFTNLRHHINQQHMQVKNFKCTDCGYSCYLKTDLERHISNVHDKFRSPCPVCGKKYSDLRQHVRIVHEGAKAECPHCKGKYSNLSQHIHKVHLKTKNIMCDKCGMTFYHNSNLKKHLETAHTGSRLMAVQPSVYPILGHPADMGFSQHYQYEAYSYAQQQYNHYHQHSHYYQHHNPAYYPRQWW